MSPRFFLYLFLLPGLSSAGVIPDCRVAESFTANTSDYPSASISLSVAGSKQHYAPVVRDCEYFDISGVVTGTEQPGYLLLRLSYSHSGMSIGPATIQFTQGRLMDQYFSDRENYPLHRVYVPYEAGVPVNLYGYVEGQAGLWDALRTSGTFYANVTIDIYVTSQMVEYPLDAYPTYIRGARWEMTPEPVSVALVVAGLAAMVVCQVRRGSDRRASS